MEMSAMFPPALHPSHLHGPVCCSPATITLIGCSKRAGKCSGCSYLSTESLKGLAQDVPSKRQWQRFFTQNRGLFLWTVPVHLEVLFPPQHCSQKKAFSLPGPPGRTLCFTWLAVISLGNSAPVWPTRRTAATLIIRLSAIQLRLNRGVTSLPLLGYAEKRERKRSQP